MRSTRSACFCFTAFVLLFLFYCFCFNICILPLFLPALILRPLASLPGPWLNPRSVQELQYACLAVFQNVLPQNMLQISGIKVFNDLYRQSTGRFQVLLGTEVIMSMHVTGRHP